MNCSTGPSSGTSSSYDDSSTTTSIITTSTDPTGRCNSSRQSQRPFCRFDRARPSPSRPDATASSTNTNNPPDLGGRCFRHPQGQELVLRRQLKECEAKLAKYRALLEQQPDITIVGSWIAEVERERKRLERDLGRKPTTRKLTTNEIKALVGQLKDIVAVLAEASPADKRAIYDELGVNLTYDPETKTVRAGAGAPHVLRVGVGGGT